MEETHCGLSSKEPGTVPLQHEPPTASKRISRALRQRTTAWLQQPTTSPPASEPESDSELRWPPSGLVVTPKLMAKTCHLKCSILQEVRPSGIVTVCNLNRRECEPYLGDVREAEHNLGKRGLLQARGEPGSAEHVGEPKGVQECLQGPYLLWLSSSVHTPLYVGLGSSLTLHNYLSRSYKTSSMPWLDPPGSVPGTLSNLHTSHTNPGYASQPEIDVVRLSKSNNRGDCQCGRRYIFYIVVVSAL
ncbi:uncharacterized protein LOC125899206 [Epinephelus fuscoguttatus]|uniref:uncharacterized protein LOC125899206 n=1 Tax=Epinephelus fuscoguttatus TaxID=293821 RepID=UPI0020D162AA|nr:uncharacterized protein LOC125899206 [Epinephelus fuscoguttatus]